MLMQVIPRVLSFNIILSMYIKTAALRLVYSVSPGHRCTFKVRANADRLYVSICILIPNAQNFAHDDGLVFELVWCNRKNLSEKRLVYKSARLLIMNWYLLDASLEFCIYNDWCTQTHDRNYWPLTRFVCVLLILENIFKRFEAIHFGVLNFRDHHIAFVGSLPISHKSSCIARSLYLPPNCVGNIIYQSRSGYNVNEIRPVRL